MSEVIIRTDALLFYELENLHHIASTLITFVDEEKVWSSLPQGIRHDQVQDDGRLQKQMQRG
jgi:hypothetical protein